MGDVAGPRTPKLFDIGFDELGIAVRHHFSPGVYAKQVCAPAGLRLAQHAHPFDHMSILASGSAIVRKGADILQVVGPAVVVIAAGVTHEIEAVTDIVWFCVHATTETDPAKIDTQLSP